MLQTLPSPTRAPPTRPATGEPTASSSNPPVTFRSELYPADSSDWASNYVTSTKGDFLKLFSTMPSAADLKNRIISGIDKSSSAAQQELHALLAASSASQPQNGAPAHYFPGLSLHARDNHQEQIEELAKQLKDADALIQQGQETLQARREHLTLCESELESAVNMSTRLLHSLLLVNAATGDLPGRLDKTQIKSIIGDLKRSLSPVQATGAASDVPFPLETMQTIPGTRTVRFSDSVHSPAPSRRPPPTPAPSFNTASSPKGNTVIEEMREGIALPVRLPGSVISAVVQDALGEDDFDTMVLARGHAVLGTNRVYH